MSPARLLAALVALTMIAGAAPAAASTGDRWTLADHRRVPLDYHHGLTHVGSDLFFVGASGGGYLTGVGLQRITANASLIPATLQGDVGFDRVGDPTYDRSGARLLVPLECHRASRSSEPNTCGVGGLGVIDPVTLAWRYWVRLDAATTTWAEISPDGEMVWTSSGRDLVAYRASDVSPRHAADGPGSASIRPLRRLRGAVPSSGVGGAAFSGGKLLLAGRSGAPRVWSVDLATGRRTPTLRLAGTRAEVEGLAVTAPSGGLLQLLLAPGAIKHPTYGTGRSELLTFVPSSYRVAASANLKGSALVVHATLRYGVHSHVLAGATVRVAGRALITDTAGDARFTLSAQPRRPLRVTVAKGGLQGVTLTVHPRTATG